MITWGFVLHDVPIVSDGHKSLEDLGRELTWQIWHICNCFANHFHFHNVIQFCIESQLKMFCTKKKKYCQAISNHSFHSYSCNHFVETCSLNQKLWKIVRFASSAISIIVYPPPNIRFSHQAKTQNIKPRPMRATAWFRLKYWLLIGRECRHVFGLQRCHCGTISGDCMFKHHLILSIIGGRCYSIEAIFFCWSFPNPQDISVKKCRHVKKDKCLTLHKCR